MKKFNSFIFFGFSVVSRSLRPVQVTEEQARLISSLQEMDLRGCSALEVYHSLVPAGESDAQEKAKKRAIRACKKAREARGASDPVKALQGIAKKLGLAGLSARWGRKS